jgi:tetratricopeptide (TPR) repeat protein
MFKPRRLWVPFIVALALNVGCSKAKTQSPAGKPKSAAATADVTTDQAEAVAAELQKAVAALDDAAFASQFDFVALGASVLSSIEGNNPEARSIRKGFEQRLDSLRAELIEQIFRHVRGGGSYQYLRTVSRVEGPRPLFRLRTSDDSLNYHELVLANGSNGVRVVDIFVYVSGERLTETMQRMLLTALPADKQTLLATISGSAKASLQRAIPLRDMTAAFKAGDHARALTIYDSLSPALRNNKAIQVIRIMAAQKVDEQKYIAAIDEFRATYPHDPSIDLMSIDSYLFAKRFDDLHSALDRLDKQLGGDPYLQVMHANAFIAEKKLDQAEKIAHQILANDPRNLDAHWVLVACSLTSKDFETTAALLTKIRDELGVPIADLAKVPDYAEFILSPAYKKWKSSP